MNWMQESDFCIDNNELHGLSPEKCFVLGVEWANMRRILEFKGFKSFSAIINEDNVTRLCILAEKYDCLASSLPLSNGWRQLRVIKRADRK